MNAQPRLRLNVLGKLSVLRDGAAMALPPSKKTRALLAYLAVTARPHSRERLCAMFWDTPDDPRAALRWSLTRLRPLIDTEDARAIIADRETVRLDFVRLSVDLLSMHNMMRNRPDTLSIDALRALAGAFDGEFLEGLDLPDCEAFQIWCIAEREEVRQLRVRLLKALISRLDGTPDEALPHARALSAIEPADEEVQADLLRLLRASGRWREAEDQYRRAQRRLEEFDVTPTGALRRAMRQPVYAGLSTDLRYETRCGALLSIIPARPER